MDFGEYMRAQVHTFAELGDATDDLQAIVDAGLPIPSGFYLLQGRLRLHGPSPASSSGHPGYTTFTHAEQVQAACRECGTVREFLVPSGGMTGIPALCAGKYTPHDAIAAKGDTGRHLSAQEKWEAGRVLEGGYSR